MFKNGLIPVAMLALALGAQAAQAEDKDPGAQAQNDKKICRTEKVTGSRTRVSRICMTQEQWDKLAENTAKSLQDMNKQQNRPSPPASNPLAGF